MAPLGRDEFIAQQREKQRQLAAGKTEAEILAENDQRVLARAAERRQQVSEWSAARQAFIARTQVAPRLDVELAAQVRTRGTSRETRPQGRRTARTSGSRGDPPESESDLLEPSPVRGVA